MRTKLIALYHFTLRPLSYLSDLLLLAMRLSIAMLFFKSGLVKIEDWDSTLYLFMEEYKVPLVSTEFAAYSGTFFELACSVLLALGLGARLASVPLMVMTAVIQFTYMMHEQHVYWAFLLATILCFGPGRISLDHFIKRHFVK